MSRLRPNARALRIAQAVENGEGAPEGALEIALYGVLRGEAAEGEPVQEALDIYEGKERHVLDALLLTNTDVATVKEGLRLRDEVLTAYQHLFFDTKVFQNVFSARRYVASLVDDGSDEFRAYELALTQGGVVLLDRYRIGEGPPLDPLQLTQNVLRELSSRSREHRGKPLSTITARESLKAARGALDAATNLRAMQPKNGGESATMRLELALSTRNHTVTAEESPVPVGELVRTGPIEAKT